MSDLIELAELVEDEESRDAADIRKELGDIESAYADLELETLLSGRAR